MSLLKKYGFLSLKNKIEKLIIPVNTYILSLNGNLHRAKSDLIIYKDIGFNTDSEKKILKNSFFRVEKIVFSKKGTPRLKVANGYVTASEQYVALTDLPVTKTKVLIGGEELIVRDDIENYLFDVKEKSVKAITDLKIYKDVGFKDLTEHNIKKEFVFKPLAIELSKGGTPRFKVAKGYVTTNKKYVELTDEAVTKTKVLISGKEQIVRDDIENYLIDLKNKSVKALADLNIYKDIGFKDLTEHQIKKDFVFKPLAIELSKGGTPRFKVAKGYVTTNKKYVELTVESVTKTKVLISGKEQVVRDDIENYLIDLKDQSVKALADLNIYKDIGFKDLTEHQIKKDFVFKPLAIELSKGGTPRFKVTKGYVTTNKKFVTLTDEKNSDYNCNTDVGIEYIDNLSFQYFKALSDLIIYKDQYLTQISNKKIDAHSIIEIEQIHHFDNKTSLQMADGFISSNRKGILQLSEVFFDNQSNKQEIDLSIVMPVYNVEEYLKQCIESILVENKVNLEIIAVNDGATDNSVKILNEFYNKDSRVKIVHKINGGLGAARNTGAKYAKGKYIWFVDSDDLIEKNSIEKVVNHLNITNSDFIVTPYNHLVDTKIKRPGYWIRNLHSKPENNTNLIIRPDVMANVTAWSKVYNRLFWLNHVKEYPENVLWEDQQPAVKSYLNSNNFDIGSFPLIQWRIRTGLTKSITQNHLDCNNLKARFEQADACIQILKESNNKLLASKRALEYLSNKTFTLENIKICTQEYWMILVDGISKLFDVIDLEEYFLKVDAQDKILYRFILNDDFESAKAFIINGGMKLNEKKTFILNENYYVEFPFLIDNMLSVNIKDCILSIKQTELITHLERIKVDQNFITIEGNAYFALIDFEDSHPLKFEIIVQERLTQKKLENLCELAPNNVMETRTQHHYNYYTNSSFVCNIDTNNFEKWISKENLKFGEFDIFVRLTDLKNGRSETSKFQGRSNRSESSVTNSIILQSENFMVCKWNSIYGLIFDYRATPVFVYGKPKLSKEYIHLKATVGSNKKFKPDYVVLSDSIQQIKLNINVISDTDFEIYIPKEILNQDYMKYQFKVFNKQGSSRVVHCSDKNLHFKFANSLLKTTNISGLELWNISSNFIVKKWLLNENKLTVILDQALSKSINKVKLSSNKMSFNGRVFGARNKIEFNLNTPEHDFLKFNGIFFGGYQLSFSNDYADDLKNVYWSNNKIFVNEFQQNTSFKVKARIVTNNTAEFFVQPLENISKKGPIWGENLRNYLMSRDKVAVEPNLVYLQCLRGDQVNDNQLSICNELLSRGGWRIVWGIEDHSVPYPKDTEAVVVGSKAYWHTLRQAKYLCFNHEVPAYLETSQNQKVIQTYHGHPFKSMGMKRWNAANLNEAQIEESLKIRRKWDYLMSPSPAATKMYRDNFPVKVEIIEVGHPRNDILATYNDNYRNELRGKIGIESNKIAVLFAPTWRDYAAADPWSSSVPQFIQPEDLADKLSEDYIVLFRGHPAHGRNGIQTIEHEKVIDVTYWKDVNDLLIACDIGVYDYSSIRFDHAVTRKPMVFFVPDKELYFKHIPPLIDYGETTPGAQVSTIEDLAIEVDKVGNNFDWNSNEEYTKFVNLFVPMDDGHATTRFVDKIFL